MEGSALTRPISFLPHHSHFSLQLRSPRPPSSSPLLPSLRLRRPSRHLSPILSSSSSQSPVTSPTPRPPPPPPPQGAKPLPLIISVAIGLAASVVPSLVLVLARGHKIESVPELPLVVSDSIESVEKTSQAIKALKQIGAFADAEKAKDSTAIRAGKGKMRNRRYVSRKGPLIVYGTEGSKIVKAFRNIPGVEVANVERLNLLKLAPSRWSPREVHHLDQVGV